MLQNIPETRLEFLAVTCGLPDPLIPPKVNHSPKQCPAQYKGPQRDVMQRYIVIS
jgi:hypothetical protein